MMTTKAKPLLTLLAAVLLAAAALTFIKFDLWNPVAPVDAAPRAALVADQYARNYGFKVDITPGPPSDLTNSWNSVTGGGFVMESTALAAAGTDTQTVAPPRIIVQELLLTGPLNAGGALSTAAALPGTADPGVAYAAVAQNVKLFTNEFDTDLSENVTRVEISPLVIPAVASGENNFQWKTFQPGPPQPVGIKMNLTVHPDDQAVRDWWDATASGAPARKDIVVNARSAGSDSPSWSTTLIECVIVEYAPWGTGLNTTGSSGASIVQTVAAKCDHVEVSPSRNDIAQALQDVLQGGAADSDRNIAITMLSQDGSDLDTTEYRSAFITRYEFPIFDANEDNVEALETVVFQADTVQLP
jgi:hypothetical protein